MELPDHSGLPGAKAALVNRVVIVGVGLMGGSLGLALVERGIAQEVVGIDAVEVLDSARAVGAIHRAGSDLCHEAAAADLVFVATPVSAIPAVLKQIAPHIGAQTTVTDLAGVKGAIALLGHDLMGDRFIGGHPMAGSETTGIGAARSNLFQGAAWAFTPWSKELEVSGRLQALFAIVRALGAAPIAIGAQEHDRAAALISHLPHLICFAYNFTVESDAESRVAKALAAGSYRDLTRVAASDAHLWRDVFIENREWLMQALGAYKAALARLEKAIQHGDSEIVLAAIQEAARTR